MFVGLAGTAAASGFAVSIYEWHVSELSCVMRESKHCICENKDADQLIDDFVFATGIIQCLKFLNTKFTASSHHQ